MIERADPTHLVVGYIKKPHGIHGEVLVTPLTDYPDTAFSPESVLRLSDGEQGTPDLDLPPLRIAAVRHSGKGLLVRFGGLEDRTQAELFAGRYLVRPVTELEPLAEGEVFYHQLLSMEVSTESGVLLGRVVEVYEGHVDLLEVHGPDGTLMVPYTPAIVTDVDVDQGRLVINPPEGLLDLRDPSS